MIIQSSIYIAICLALIGCTSGWKDGFEEKPVKAYPYASIKDISDLISNGSICKYGDDVHNKLHSHSNGIVHRTKESVCNIYIMPYEDGNNIYHDGHMLYCVSKPSCWCTHLIQPEYVSGGE